jgi:hypothetical protein
MNELQSISRVVVASLIVTALQAQNPPQPAGILTLDVLLSDKSGNPIPNLQKADSPFWTTSNLSLYFPSRP